MLGTPNPGALARHRAYVRALETTGVEIALGRFRRRSRRCPICKKIYVAHEEKETDVAIAVRIVELAVSRGCECQVVVTGDTDILPAVPSGSGTSAAG